MPYDFVFDFPLAAVSVIYGVRRMGWRGANSHAIKNNSASNAGYAIIINANWINGRVSDWDFEYNVESPFCCS